MNRPIVVKIGGSLLRTGAATPLLRALPAGTHARLAIVPGGGAFADAVRAAQGDHHLSDVAAHHMALLAMDMSARMIVDLAHGYAVAATRDAFDAAWSRETIPVWAPTRMATADAQLPQSWDMTSDSLAAWLAARIEASWLVVVKSCPVPEAASTDAVALATAGIVDACFPQAATDRGFEWAVVSGAEAALAKIASL